MSNSIYIASIQSRSGKSLAALGLMELVSRRVHRIGFFRPIVRDTAQADREIRLMRERYSLEHEPEVLCALSYEEARVLSGAGRSDELLERVLARYKDLESQCDFVVCEGTDYTGSGAAFEFEFNARVAGHLGCPVFFVANGQESDANRLLEDVMSARREFTREGVSIVATLVNRVAPEQLTAVRDCFASRWNEEDPVYVVPESEVLGHPTLAEIMSALDGRLLYGSEHCLGRLAADYTIAAMELPRVLERLSSGSVVITGGDRTDIVLGCLASVRSEPFPNIAGVILTGGIEPPTPVARLIEGLRRPSLPIIAVESDTFATATAINEMDGAITAGDERKVASALGLFEEHVDLQKLEERIRVSRSERMTPLRFEYELIERAKASRQHIVLPEGNDERVQRAAEIVLRRGIADLTLLGVPQELEESAATLGISLEGAALVDPLTSPWRTEFANTYMELRKHKGVNEDMALDAMGDESYFGSMMVHLGRVDGMVSGAVNTTAQTIRPALEFIKTKKGVSVVSSVFLMCLSDRVLVYGDCAINPNPNPTQLADIAICSAETAAMFGIEPRIAMLSYSTGVSGAGDDVNQVREATEIVRARRPDLKIEGPIQYDAAVDPGVARTKLPGSEVAGQATVFIFPDLNTGNNTYKAVQRSAGASAVGPALQGLNAPVNDLSRGCTVNDIVNTVAVTAIQAQVANETS